MTTPFWIKAAMVIIPFLSGIICSMGFAKRRSTILNFLLWLMFSFTITIFAHLLANAATGTPSFSPIP